LLQDVCQGILDDRIYQAYLQRSLGVDLFGRYQHFKRPGFANEPRKALRPSPARDQAEGSAAVTEDGVGRGDAAMAGKREIEASAHAVAGDGRERWGGELLDHIHQLLTRMREGQSVPPAQLRDLIQISSCGKVRNARNDQWKHRRTGAHDAFNFLAKSGHLGAGQPIHSIAGRKGEKQNTRIVSQRELNFGMVANCQGCGLYSLLNTLVLGGAALLALRSSLSFGVRL
jgi:hypothetical protein